MNGEMYMCSEAVDIFPVHRCYAQEPSFHGVEYAP